MKERIVAVAVTGLVVCSLPRPARHHNVLKFMHDLGLQKPDQSDQGFLTSEGRWVSREDAHKIATAAGQTGKTTIHDDVLFSEDLW